MRIPKQRLFLIAGLILIVLGFGLKAWSGHANAPTTEPTPEQVQETPAEEGAEAPEPPRTAIVRESNVVTTLAVKSADESTKGTATLIVDGARYALTAPEGTTLKEALDRLDAEGDFSYEYRDYSGLGAFVTHINGRASTGDLVWILYANGKKSGTGISSTRIRSGDVIEWKLEESY